MRYVYDNGMRSHISLNCFPNCTFWPIVLVYFVYRKFKHHHFYVINGFAIVLTYPLFQNTMLQLLELLLVDGVPKEWDVSLSCPSSVPVDLLPTSADKDDDALWQDNVKCMLRGTKLYLCALSSFTSFTYLPKLVAFVSLTRFCLLSGKRSRE